MNNMEARAKTSTRYHFKDLIWLTMKYCLSIPKKSKSSETGVTMINGIVLFLLICYKLKKIYVELENSPVSIYLLKVNNRNTRARCEICSKLTIKTPEGHQLCRSGAFIVNFDHISHLFLGFLLLTFNCRLG